MSRPVHTDGSIQRIARLLLDTGPGGMALLEGPDLVFTFVNPAYQALAPGRPMLGRTLVEVWPELADRIVPALRRVRETGLAFEADDWRLDLPRGGTVAPAWLRFSFHPVPGRPGEPAAIAAHAVERTAMVLAGAREEQRDDVLRAISHDLQTPLTVIAAQAQLLARRPEDRETVLRRTEAIGTSAARMAAMVQDLLDLVRLEAGQVRLEPRPVPLAPFAAELRERLKGAVDVERLRVAVPEALPPALADPPRLERILVNLITNALKYSPADREATLSAGRADAGIRISVLDRGPGIPPEEVPRVFERFYRGAGAAIASGLGLGLYITRLLVEAHGGRIHVESAVGEGSTFHVLLPAA